MHLLTLRAFFTDRNDRFPYFLFTLVSKSPPFYIHEAQIGFSFWAEPPRIGHCKEYPPPPSRPRGTFQEYFRLLVPIKVKQLPSYHTWKMSLNEY